MWIPTNPVDIVLGLEHGGRLRREEALAALDRYRRELLIDIARIADVWSTASSETEDADARMLCTAAAVVSIRLKAELLCTEVCLQGLDARGERPSVPQADDACDDPTERRRHGRAPHAVKESDSLEA